MLKPAQLYGDEIKKKFIEIYYDEKFRFYNGSSYYNEYIPSDSTWAFHEFVSIENNNIIGYIKYRIARDTHNVLGLSIVNFSGKPNYIFSKDMHIALRDIFEKYRFNKISFSCVIGNPIEKSYDKICLKYGGRIVGIHLKDEKLLDGLYYDSKDYEILREDYLQRKVNK